MPTFCGLQTRQFNDPEAQSYSKFEFVVFGTHNIYYIHTEKKKHHRPVSRQGQHQNHDNLGNRPTSGIPGCLTTRLPWMAGCLASCLNPKKLLLWNTYLRPRLTKDLSKMARMEDCSHTNNKKKQQPKKIIIHAYH